MYHNTQRNSSGIISPPPMNPAKANLGSDRPDALTRLTEGYLIDDNQPADLRSEILSSTARSPVSPTTSMTIIIPAVSQVSSSAFATPPPSSPDPARCHSPCIHIPNLSPSPARSSSPATSAFKTPDSSFIESNPPSPSLTSTRPAPPSPAVSRRGSGLSLKQRPQSRRQSGLAIEVIPFPIDVDSTPIASTKETPTAAAIPISAAMPAPPNFAASAASVVAATVLTPTPAVAADAENVLYSTPRRASRHPAKDMQHGPGDGDTLSSLLSILKKKKVCIFSNPERRSDNEPVEKVFDRVCHKRNDYRSSVQSALPRRLRQRCLTA